MVKLPVEPHGHMAKGVSYCSPIPVRFQWLMVQLLQIPTISPGFVLYFLYITIQHLQVNGRSLVVGNCRILTDMQFADGNFPSSFHNNALVDDSSHGRIPPVGDKPSWITSCWLVISCPSLFYPSKSPSLSTILFMLSNANLIKNPN